MLDKYFHPGTKLSGARVVITGAASGIGRLMAIRAAQKGASLALWDLNLEAAEALAGKLRARGVKAIAYKVDVSKLASINTAAEATLEEFGGADVVINCAGIVTGKNFLDISDKQLQLIYDVNVLALYRITKQFLPGMIERENGCVVNIASAAGLIGVPKQTDYSGTKAAAMMFSDALRSELRRQGHPIQVMAVCPYYIDTGMFSGVSTRFPALLPILKPKYVAERIIRGIENGSRLLVIPWFARSPFLLRLFPVPIFDILSDFFGINEGMDEFVGRR